MSLTERSRRAGIVTLVAGLAIAAVAVAVFAGSRSRPAPVGDRIQGPQPAAASITNASGVRVACPLGSVPYVNITNAYFTPRLVAGQYFDRGHYMVRLTGTVANETTSAVDIEAIVATVAHRTWSGARVIGPRHLAANSSGRLAISGRVDSRRRAAALVGARMRWHWADPSLVPCRSRGLIDDD